MLATDVPEALFGRGIEPAVAARGFAISLDTAEPWGGGCIEGRVEARDERHARSVVTVSVACSAAWVDVAPELVGQSRPGINTLWNLRTRAVPIWIDEEVWLERWELGELDRANWLHFRIDLPPALPRAIEGTFVSFRWRVAARRPRRVGHESASAPLLLVEPRAEPTVRVETSPLGSWRLLEWKSEAERDASGGPCSVAYEQRRPEDAPLPGETSEAERRRRAAA